MEPAIQSDADLSNFGGEDDAVQMFLDKLMPEDAEKRKREAQPSESGSGEEANADTTAQEDPKASEETAPDEEGQTTEQEEGEGETEEGEPKYADDDAYRKIKVGDEEHAVPVKELERLYGQEQSLTKKSMEVAEQRKRVDAELAKNTGATAALLQRAQQRWEPYSKIDFNIAAHELPREEYTALRQAAQAAWEDVNFLQNNLNQFVQEATNRQQQSLHEQAVQALEVLTGPTDKGGVEGWNEHVYNEVVQFGLKQGLRREVVDNLVDPVALRLLHSAMLYERGKSKVVVTKKVNKTPTRVIKTTNAPEAGRTNPSKEAAATKKLRTTGSTDAAADLFMARWAARDAAQQ